MINQAKEGWYYYINKNKVDRTLKSIIGDKEDLEIKGSDLGRIVVDHLVLKLRS